MFLLQAARHSPKQYITSLLRGLLCLQFPFYFSFSMGYLKKFKTITKNKKYFECWTAKEEMRVIKTVKSLVEGAK